MTHVITIDIIPGEAGKPPTVRASASKWEDWGEVVAADSASILMDNTDEAMVARAMLQSAAYLFAQGQPVEFGPEIPREVLK